MPNVSGIDLKTVDWSNLPVYIELAGELVVIGKTTIETILAAFGLTPDEIAAWRARLAAEQGAIDALVTHLHTRVPEA